MLFIIVDIYKKMDSQDSQFISILAAIQQLKKTPDLSDQINQFWKNSEIAQTPEFAQAMDQTTNSWSEFLQFVEKLNSDQSIPSSPLTPASPSKNRIYIDGCFDMIHSGHYNAIRQAKSLGAYLVMGIHSDQQITQNKGPPVMGEVERYQLARCCKWVDEVAEDAPFTPTPEWLDEVGCFYGVHGDDITPNATGQDAYQVLRDAGRLKIIKRTEGISTTALVGKLLLMTKTEPLQGIEDPITSTGMDEQKTKLLTTSRRISQFSNGRVPGPDDIVVYIDGSWDLFHVGHAKTLEAAKAMGTFLIVGLHDDVTVNQYKGSNYPIMNLQERALCVMAQRSVDEVVMGAPWTITEDIIKSFNISYVVQGTIPKTSVEAKLFRKGSVDVDADPFVVPKNLGIYREVTSSVSLETKDIVERIIDNRLNYVQKFMKKNEAELDYYKNKVFLEEY